MSMNRILLISRILKFLPIERFRNPPPTVGVVRMNGVISAGGSPLRRGNLSFENLTGPLEKAFGLANLSAIALLINSPGGSPVQSSLIAKRVRDLADEKDIPVFAFAEDVAASGGYWLACAADEIYADAASIIGSIGVITAGFGFQDFIGRHGIERRVHSAGGAKSQLDPFQAEKPEDVTRLKAIQTDIHVAFTDYVRSRRQSRLKGDDEMLFSGEFWAGTSALELGLIDGIGDLRTVMLEKFGKQTKLVPVGERRSWFNRRLGFGVDRVGKGWFGGRDGFGNDLSAGLVAAVVAAVEDRALWKRFEL